MEQTFGERLRNYRRDRGLTQQELADRLGVSNKTVSRWESDGGYPDVPLLAPLARALGVCVDDLLDGERPVRKLSRTDWQNLLSFAFALGGGVLFFLLRLFMPALICYLIYLGCLAYGVYLQRYYAYHSRWFFYGDFVMNAAVNLSAAVQGIAAVAAVPAALAAGLTDSQWTVRVMEHMPQILLAAGVVIVLLALGLTAATQYLVWRKGGFFPERGNERLRLVLERPRLRAAAAAVLPLLAGGFWLLQLLTPPPLGQIEGQKAAFLLLLPVLAAIFTLPLLKKGFRKWIAPVWCMSALCWNLTALLRYAYWMPFSSAYLEEWTGTVSNSHVWIVGRGTAGSAVFALCLAAVWLVLCCVRLRWEERRDASAA